MGSISVGGGGGGLRLFAQKFILSPTFFTHPVECSGVLVSPPPPASTPMFANFTCVEHRYLC